MESSYDQEYLYNIVSLLRRGSKNSLYLKELSKQRRFDSSLRDVDLANVVEYSSVNFPCQIKGFKNSPIVLFLYNTNYINIRNKYIIGITGSRELDDICINEISEVMSRLKIYEKKIMVVTGGAKGVDGCCSEFCRRDGISQINVVPSLLRDKCSNLSTISLYPEGTTIEKRMFLERNFIISALCNILIVFKAGLYSGSMNTARQALRLKKEVFVNDRFDNNGKEYDGNVRLLENGCRSLAKISEFLDSVVKSV